MNTSVYVHFPWCAKKCPYCDFASSAAAETTLPHDEYADAVIRELKKGDLRSRRLVSIFVGGGTPSMWDPRALTRVVGAIRDGFGAEAADLEITVECNPASLSPQKISALVHGGVNRLSIGVQSLQEEQLTFLGRLHSGPRAREALQEALRQVPRVSADLMFGMPNQVQLLGDIESLLALRLSHISAYALTIEPGTQFGELHKRGRLKVADDNDYADMFQHAERTFEAAGLEHYEVSNYARPGDESRHNQHYWRGGDYLGLGAGAVGALLDRPGRLIRTRNDPRPERYMAGADPVEVETLGGQDIVREAFMLGLRTQEGVDLADAARRSGVTPLSGREQTVERRCDEGDLQWNGDRLVVPRHRWLFLDGIVADLF